MPAPRRALQTPPDRPAGPLGRGLVIPALLACLLLPCRLAVAQEHVAARRSILAADASRHVSALAADAFEGREGGSRGGQAAGAYIADALQRMPLVPAGDGGSYFQRFGSMRNILALLPGSDPVVAEELIVVGAHYDHVGYGTAATSNGPTGFIHNGADDNASGVAGLIEVAEALTMLPTAPRRSILIAFWDGEEKGLLGSYHFLRVRPQPLSRQKIVFSLNLDMIGRLRGERLEVFGGRSAQGLRALLVGANAATNLELVFDWEIADDSDHYPFIAAQIPTLMLHTGLHEQYHRPSDDTELVNFAGIEPVAQLALDCVTAVANGTQVPVFRPRCRQESPANRSALESPAAEPLSHPAGARPRWGMGTREDPGEPTAPVVVRITPHSPLARAGLAIGDRVVSIDHQTIGDQADMVQRLGAAGNRVVIEVDRRGRMLRLEAVAE